jgi:hypothetical protein
MAQLNIALKCVAEKLKEREMVISEEIILKYILVNGEPGINLESFQYWDRD